MIIESINIKSFGLITDLSLDFSKDINVIVGHNEAGKSTIAAFIKFMLYGFGNEKVGDGPDERQRRINWDNGTAQGSMTVRVGEKRYLITRTSERIDTGARPSYKEDSVITDLDTGSPAFGKVPAGEVFFGVDKELFENTAFIGQIGDSAINEGSVKQSIENILFSGSEKINNQRAANKVALKMENLLHKSGTGGDIHQLRTRVEKLEESYAAAKKDNKEILDMEARLHEIRMIRKKQIEGLDKLTDLDLCYRNMIIIQMFDELHTHEQELIEKSAEYEAFVASGEREGYTPTESYLTELSLARRSVDDAYRTLADAEAAYEREKGTVGITGETEAAIKRCDTLGGEKNLISKAKELRKKQIIGIASGALCALVLIAALVFQIAASGTLAEPLFRVLFAIPAVLALGGAIWLLVFVLSKTRELKALETSFSTDNLHDLVSKLGVVAEDRAKRDKLINDTEFARVAVESARLNYESAKRTLLEIILRWGKEPPTTNLNDFLNNLEAEVREFLAEANRLLTERSELEIRVKELRNNLQDKNEVEIRAQVSPMKRKVLAAVAHDEMIESIAEHKRKIAEQDKLAETVERELSLLKLRAADPSEIYARIQELNEKICSLTEVHLACEMARRAIESGSDNLRLEISPRLGQYSAELMGVMTDKKYRDIDVTDGLKVSFVTPEGEKKSVDFLSGGTRDLTYISLRMALVDMLYTEKPPVCFDESFAHQDNVRASAMMRAIKKLAASGQQSFIFTCREREARFAKEISKTASVYKFPGTADEMV